MAVAATLLALTSCDDLNEEPVTVPRDTHFNATYSTQDDDKALKSTFADNGTVCFYQDDELCGAATYTVTEDGDAQIATTLFTKPWGNVSAADTATPLTATATFSGDDLHIVLKGKTLTFTKSTTSSETTNPGNNDNDNDDDASGTKPGNNNGDNTGGDGNDDDNTNPGGDDDNKNPGNDDNTNPGGNDDDDKD
ncbi:MAG: hypothetical protein K2K67_03940, partial [Treponemataceae bacterium]|nr:hypothetical protein [Treponemataceae bacterium]